MICIISYLIFRYTKYKIVSVSIDLFFNVDKHDDLDIYPFIRE